MTSNRLLGVALLAVVLTAGCGNSAGVTAGGGTGTPPPPAPSYSTSDAAVAPSGATVVQMVKIGYVPTQLWGSGRTLVLVLQNIERPENDPGLGVPHYLDHNFVISDARGNFVGQSTVLAPGESKLFTVAHLPAGQYKFFCSRFGHRSQFHMEGTLSQT